MEIPTYDAELTPEAYNVETRRLLFDTVNIPPMIRSHLEDKGLQETRIVRTGLDHYVALFDSPQGQALAFASLHEDNEGLYWEYYLN